MNQGGGRTKRKTLLKDPLGVQDTVEKADGLGVDKFFFWAVAEQVLYCVGAHPNTFSRHRCAAGHTTRAVGWE